MSAKLQVWMKPGCVTCRRVIDYLQERHAPVELRDIFRDTPSEEEIRQVLARLQLPAKELLRSRDRMYRELGLGTRDLPEGELIHLMAQHPGLLRRPILVRARRAVIAPDSRTAEAFLP